MTESQFIEQNKEKWRELELLLELPQKDADKLQELFVKVSSDLSYARTFYPKRSVRLYLNNLTQKVFDSMGKKKSGFSLKNISHFFGVILPEEAYRQRKMLLISFLIFVVSVTIGALSSANNPEFAKVILGDSYIEMTENNINKLDPMAVYKDENAIGMFSYITVNNIRVAFLAFVLGLLGGVGTVFILVSNGIMVGVFQYFFYQKGLFLTSFLTIWIHGTIEISAIIIAGAAGIILGNGLLFPGTYKRSTAMQISSKRALRILLGTIPLFIIAGLLESFVTRLTDLPLIVKVSIIAFSLLFVLTMYVFYPYYYKKKISNFGEQTKVTVQHDEQLWYNRFEFRTFGENIGLAFAQFRAFFGFNFTKIIMPCLGIAAVLFYFFVATKSEDAISLVNFYGNNWFSPQPIELSNFFVPFINTIFVSFSICYMEVFMKNNGQHVDGIMSFMKQHFIYILFIIMAYYLSYVLIGLWSIVLIFILPIQIIPALIDLKVEKQKLGTNNLKHNLGISYRYYFHFMGPELMSAIFLFLFLLLLRGFFGQIFVELITWHSLFDDYFKNYQFINHIIYTGITLLIVPLIYFLYSNSYYSYKCKSESIDLKLKLQNFGQSKKLFEE